MRKFFVTLSVCILSAVFCIPAFAKADKQVVVLSCNLHCQGCCDKIMKNIAFEKGVKDIVCDLDTKTVTVTYDANKTDIPALLAAFEKIKKPATVKEAEPASTLKPQEETPTDANTGASQLQ